MKKAVIYTRLSSKTGTDYDGQREKLIAKFGKEYKIVGEFRDVASGTQEIQDRPGLKAMLDAVAKGEVEVLCTDITRLTRSLSLEIIGAIQKAGVQIVTTDGTEIGSADLVAHMLINQMPKTVQEDQSQRIKRGIRAARQQNMQRRSLNPRKPPFGYSISEQNGIGQIVLGKPEEVDVVRWIFSAFELPDGTYRQIVSDLNTKGTPSPSGTKWHLAWVLRILQNRAYGGFSKEPPLVSVEQFERVQARISRM